MIYHALFAQRFYYVLLYLSLSFCLKLVVDFEGDFVIWFGFIEEFF